MSYVAGRRRARWELHCSRPNALGITTTSCCVQASRWSPTRSHRAIDREAFCTLLAVKEPETLGAKRHFRYRRLTLSSLLVGIAPPQCGAAVDHFAPIESEITFSGYSERGLEQGSVRLADSLHDFVFGFRELGSSRFPSQRSRVRVGNAYDSVRRDLPLRKG
jgi:hypothetical protein